MVRQNRRLSSYRRFPSIQSICSSNRNTQADPIALYVFYLYVATWQRTNQPKATTRFCAIGLRITEARIRAAKKMLIKLDLVEDHVDRGSKGRVNGHYIHVKYVRSGDRQAVDLPDGGNSQNVVNCGPNASSANKGNALSDFKVNALSASEKNALSTPNPLSGGAAVLDSVKDLASKLLTCLKQDPNRPLTPREKRALSRVEIHPTVAQYELLQNFYEQSPDPHRPFDLEQRLLRLRKFKLSTLVADLPQQIAHAEQWDDERYSGRCAVRHLRRSPSNGSSTQLTALRKFFC